MAELVKHTKNISSGTTTPAFNFGPGHTPVKMYMPTGIASTSATFQISDSEGGTYSPLKSSGGSAISYTVAADGWYTLDPASFVGAQYLKVVMGSSETNKDISFLAQRLGF